MNAHVFNPATDTCQKCKFWASQSGDYGECRKRSPRGTREGAVWPQTEAFLWCGDYEPSVSSAARRAEHSLVSLEALEKLHP